jgi:amino acid transporter
VALGVPADGRALLDITDLVRVLRPGTAVWGFVCPQNEGPSRPERPCQHPVRVLGQNGGMAAPHIERHGTLGTFAGVFTPSILTILGIILFLRMGFVVGNAGLVQTLLIIGLATGVAVLTSISLAAIATNIEVKGGGDYYLISRTLGVEFGGAIGVVLFLAQSVSVGFYAIGFGEVAADLLGLDSKIAVQVIALIAVLILFGFTWAGADVASRFQFVVMAFLVAALLSFFAGAFGSSQSAILDQSWTPPPEALGFWAVFAIFFPAVTGFTQGVSMSGDLKDPARSLPVGTFAAVGLSTVVYVSVAVVIAASVPQAQLVDDAGEAMRSIALIGPLIVLGGVAATLSSAMASFLGAPRILQSLASDRVFPALGFFATGHGPHANPRRAAMLSLVIALLTLGLGSLDAIAAVVSMFFLISYGLLNYATYWEARAKSPAFRPRFRFFNHRLSLLGAAACLGAMLAINVVAGAAALAVMFIVYQYLARRQAPKRWADSASSHHFHRATESIKALSNEEQHARNWRPQILAFSADPTRRERLLRFASWLEGGSGLTVAMRVLQGDGAVMRRERDAAAAELQSEIEALGVDVYSRVVLAADGMEALPVVVQSFGVGALRANTALFGWPESPAEDRRLLYVRSLRDVARLGVNVVTMSSDEQRWGALTARTKRNRRIDVWWSDDDSGRLALLTAYLFTRTPEWSRASIRVLAAATADGLVQARSDLQGMLAEARIEAEAVCLVDPDQAAIVSACADAALVLVTMRIRGDATLDALGGDLDLLLRRLPMTAAVLAGEPVDLLAGPESGRHVTLAEAEGALTEAKARLKTLEGQLSEATAAVDNARLWAVPDEPEDEAEIEELTRQREAVLRRTLKARARVERAQADVDELVGG